MNYDSAVKRVADASYQQTVSFRDYPPQTDGSDKTLVLDSIAQRVANSNGELETLIQRFGRVIDSLIGAEPPTPAKEAGARPDTPARLWGLSDATIVTQGLVRDLDRQLERLAAI